MSKISVHFSSKRQDWRTPQNFFNQINAEFGFDLDASATKENAKCNVFLSEGADDALTVTWSDYGSRAFMNPPYGREIGKFVKKASESGIFVACLVPSRTDTKWWHEYVIPRASEVRFIRGRLKFDGHRNSAPFPSALVIYNKHTLRSISMHRAAA